MGDMHSDMSGLQSPVGASTVVATPAKRACDSCHRRKVKCIPCGMRACRNCVAANLTCTYNAVPQKKGPKGSQAKVISELRETQRQSLLAADPTAQPLHTYHYPYNPGHRSSLLTTELISVCMDFFFSNLYPTLPILDRHRFGETIATLNTNIEAYSLVSSLCAYTLVQPNMTLPSGFSDDINPDTQLSQNLGQRILQDAVRAHKSIDNIDVPSASSIITSFFLFGSHFSLGRQNLAWFHLREATTSAVMAGLDDESSYTLLEATEAALRRRLFWLLFVTERAYSLGHHRPTTLQPRINMPALEDNPAEVVSIDGFLYLISLFQPFDDVFLAAWNRTRFATTSEELAQLHGQLHDALPIYPNCTDAQAVDLHCTKQWLRTIVWQLSVRQGFVTPSAPPNDAMSVELPIEIARDLLNATNQYPPHAMEAHGVAFVEKLFDVASALVDVIACITYDPSSTSSYASRDYLAQLTALISSLRGGRELFLPLLQSKTSTLVSSHPTYSLIPTSSIEETGTDYGTGYLSDASTSSTSYDSPIYGSPLWSPYGMDSVPRMAPTSAPLGIAHPMAYGSSESIVTPLDLPPSSQPYIISTPNEYPTTPG